MYVVDLRPDIASVVDLLSLILDSSVFRAPHEDLICLVKFSTE